MVCGPKCAGFMLFMGIWGTIFLGVLGGLFYNESIGLLDDLPKESDSDIEKLSWTERVSKTKDAFHQQAYNSWIACGGYALVAILSALRMACLAR